VAGGARDSIVTRPITQDRQKDFEALMKTNSITGSCWDIWPRRLGPDAKARHAFWEAKGVSWGEGNRRDMKRLVRGGAPVGLIAYRDGEPVGFVSVGPRTAYPRVDASKTSPRVDEVPVWVVPCFYVHREHRGLGVTTALLRAAVEYAAKRGAPAVEGYPRADDAPRVSAESAFFGTEAQFRRAGYRKVRGVRADLPRGWAPRVTMRASCGSISRRTTLSRSRTPSPRGRSPARSS
jgi:GNAT superfamily N-acetyltransferase